MKTEIPIHHIGYAGTEPKKEILWALALRFGRQRNVIAVESIRDASRRWQAFRDINGLSMSTSPRVTIIDTNTGTTVARISYNGRCWHPKTGKEIEC